MDLDFFFGTPAGAPVGAPTKSPPQPKASGGYDFAQQQSQSSFFPQQQQQQQQQQPGYFPQQQPYQQQPYSMQQPYSQPPFGGQPAYGAPQPGYSALQPSYGAGYGAPHPGFGAPQPYGQSFGGSQQNSSSAIGHQSPSLLPQPSAKPAPSNNDFFDIFGGEVLGSSSQPKSQPQSQAAPVQPQTIQYSNDDFLDLLGGNASSAKTSASSKPASSAQATEQQATSQASTFKRGQAKKDAATKKDLNLDAFSQLAVSRSKAPTASSAASKKAVAESESESESESEDDDDNTKGPKNIDDDEQNMGTGQGFSPMDRGTAGGASSGAKKCVAADCNNTFSGAGKYCAAHQRYESHPPESKDADGRKVKGEWSIERKRTGTKMGFIKNITIWKFYFKGEQHSIELRHSTFSGKRVILVDRRQLLSEKRLIGGDAAHKVFAGSDFETRCEVTVVIKSNNDRFQYGIFIEGLPIRDAKLKYAEYV